MKPHQLEETMTKLKLFGMLETLETRLAQATAGELGHVELLQSLCEDEAARRNAAGIERRVKAALRADSPTTSPSTRRSRLPIRDLSTLRFVEAGDAVVLHGPSASASR